MKDIERLFLVLRFLCRNPCGMFWAGDTAQQITSTAFRFSDLKAFLYRIEVCAGKSFHATADRAVGSRHIGTVR
jgi:hypothetical protein